MTKAIIRVGDLLSLRHDGTTIQGRVVELTTGLNPRYNPEGSTPYYSHTVRIAGIAYDFNLTVWQAFSVLPSAEAHA